MLDFLGGYLWLMRHIQNCTVQKNLEDSFYPIDEVSRRNLIARLFETDGTGFSLANHISVQCFEDAASLENWTAFRTIYSEE